MSSDEIGKISWVQIVKDLVNHMNEFELYPAAKEKTMESFKQGSNTMAFFFFLRMKTGSKACKRLERGEMEAGIWVGNVCNNPGKKNSGWWE